MQVWGNRAKYTTKIQKTRKTQHNESEQVEYQLFPHGFLMNLCNRKTSPSVILWWWFACSITYIPQVITQYARCVHLLDGRPMRTNSTKVVIHRI